MAGLGDRKAWPRTAIRSPRAVAMFLGVALAALAADLGTKHYVFRWLLQGPSAARRVALARAARPDADPSELLPALGQDVAPGVRFTPSVNPGVVFGLPVPRPLVNLATAAAMVFILALFAGCDPRNRLMQVALGLILGGAAGNLYDRLFSRVSLPGEAFDPIRYHVRDFIDLARLHYPWVFNVADALLVVGVILLMLHWLLQGRQAATHQAVQPSGKGQG